MGEAIRQLQARCQSSVNPAYAWEPVIVHGGRTRRERSEPTVRDWVAASITLRRGLSGAKPMAFCYWLFGVLGLRPGDELIDLFPGTGAVTAAWSLWQERETPTALRLPLEASA